MKEATDVFKRHKRAPIRPPILESDIYVSRNTLVPPQIKRIHSLLERKLPNVTIHGLGIAINKAVEVALRYKQQYPAATWEIKTTTELLFDDLESMDLDEDSKLATRNNSAIHITML